MAVIAGAAAWAYLVPRLPSIEILKDVRLQVPLRVYTRDGKVVAEFGEQRRTPLQMDQIPPMMVKAVLASEDERFYEHPGVDWQGIARAVWHLLRTGEKGPGGSTITMQVARNFFLGREKTYIRKLNEILLAIKIERELGKNEILELYLNKIFLGHRAYGVGAAAQVYYGKPIDQLSLPQVAMIAGLPKAPSRFNPIVNPERAVERRNYVLGRMRDLGFISAADHDAAAAAPVSASVHGLAVEVEAPYVAEMVRAHLQERFGDEAYTGGFSVYTTLDSRRQRAANAALRAGLVEYDRRHGYRGPELRAAAGTAADAAQVLADIPVLGGLPPALVTAVEEREARVVLAGGESATLAWEGIEWARPYIDANRRGASPKTAADVLAPGDVVRVTRTEEGHALAQVPAVDGALVSLDPDDGAIVALVGGFDFYRSKFNRAVQAERQPGSSFKPFIYSAALEQGYTPASIINDAPVVFDDPSLEAAWRPENYSGKFFGPTRLREALTFSRNLVSIRLLRAIGVDAAIDYITRFGFDPARLPRNLSLALGSATVAPLEVARGYAVFANGGFRVTPYFLARIVDGAGEVILEASPERVCRPCEHAPPAAPAGGGAEPAPAREPTAQQPLAPRAIPAQNAWLMGSMMRDVIRRGTGRRARQLGRSDLAGKTGTTNDQRDAWFSGFNTALVATAWVGFDDLQPLGARETGGRAALPVWMGYMAEALAGVPEEILDQPDGLVTVRIDPETGQLAGADQAGAIFETFRVGQAPTRVSKAPTAAAPGGAEVPEQLF